MQGSLFATATPVGAAPVGDFGGRLPAPRPAVKRRAVAVPHGQPDKKGRYWFQRFAEEVDALPAVEREVVLAFCIEWPEKRQDEFMRLARKWIAAAPLERDNFAEFSGRA